MSDDVRFGVTPDGFVIKGIDVILAELHDRARQMFGDDLDLGSGSPVRKILDAVAWQSHELWRALERQYYANFISTAEGSSLDLLGADLGLLRRNLRSKGQVTLQLQNGEATRTYVVPEGAILETPGGSVRFRTVGPATLTGPSEQATVDIEAMVAGPDGNAAAGPLQINAAYQRANLNLGPATLTASTAKPFTGGELVESDSDYRAFLSGSPRSLWTMDRVIQTVREVPGVRDCRVFDPLGGVDVSQSYFNLFLFGQRSFSQDRRLVSPYFFDIVVAAEPGWPWQTDNTGSGPPIQGVFESIVDAIREVRPVSIFPNIVQANQVEIGIRATLFASPGHNLDSIRHDILDGIHQYVSGLGLGSDVLHSSVLVIARTAAGVVDVQNLHLRRCPPLMGGINFGGALFNQSVEAAVGENISINPDEVTYFRIDSELIDLEVVNQ